jgi:hypothetical protein
MTKSCCHSTPPVFAGHAPSARLRAPLTAWGTYVYLALHKNLVDYQTLWFLWFPRRDTQHVAYKNHYLCKVLYTLVYIAA